jgi:integrase
LILRIERLEVARLEGFEPPAYRFEVSGSNDFLRFPLINLDYLLLPEIELSGSGLVAGKGVFVGDEKAFTEKRIKDLPLPAAGAKQVYYRDGKTRGFVVAVYPTGAKTFILYRKVSGRPERILIGRWGDLSVEVARGIADEMNGAIAKGENPAEERRQTRLEGSFENLWNRYLELHAKPHKQPRSVAEDEANYRRYLSGWATRRLSAIHRRDIEKIHADLAEKNGVYAANRVLALLSTVFNRATEWGWSGVNPCKGVRKFPEESRDRFLTQDEMPRFINALADEPNRDFRDFIMLDLLTGARRSNLLAMRWEEIDFAGAAWRIPRTKGNKSQTIPLAGPALRILQSRRESVSGDWVFPSPVIPSQHVQEYRKPWGKLLERAKIEDLRFHDVRRTLGSWLSKSGAGMPIIKAALGHADIATTQIYTRSEDAGVRHALEVVAQRMLGAGNE